MEQLPRVQAGAHCSLPLQCSRAGGSGLKPRTRVQAPAGLPCQPPGAAASCHRDYSQPPSSLAKRTVSLRADCGPAPSTCRQVCPFMATAALRGHVNCVASLCDSLTDKAEKKARALKLSRAYLRCRFLLASLLVRSTTNNKTLAGPLRSWDVVSDQVCSLAVP